MLLHGGVTEIVARSAPKHRQMRRPVQFEGTATATWTEQAQSAGRTRVYHGTEREAKPPTPGSIRDHDNLAILYDNMPDYVRRHRFSPRSVRPPVPQIVPPTCRYCAPRTDTARFEEIERCAESAVNNRR